MGDGRISSLLLLLTLLAGRAGGVDRLSPTWAWNAGLPPYLRFVT